MKKIILFLLSLMFIIGTLLAEELDTSNTNPEMLSFMPRYIYINGEDTKTPYMPTIFGGEVYIPLNTLFDKLETEVLEDKGYYGYKFRIRNDIIDFREGATYYIKNNGPKVNKLDMLYKDQHVYFLNMKTLAELYHAKVRYTSDVIYIEPFSAEIKVTIDTPSKSLYRLMPNTQKFKKTKSYGYLFTDDVENQVDSIMTNNLTAVIPKSRLPINLARYIILDVKLDNEYVTVTFIPTAFLSPYRERSPETVYASEPIIRLADGINIQRQRSSEKITYLGQNIVEAKYLIKGGWEDAKIGKKTPMTINNLTHVVFSGLYYNGEIVNFAISKKDILN